MKPKNLSYMPGKIKVNESMTDYACRVETENKAKIYHKQHILYDEIAFVEKACELDSLWQELTRLH